MRRPAELWPESELDRCTARREPSESRLEVIEANSTDGRRRKRWRSPTGLRPKVEGQSTIVNPHVQLSVMFASISSSRDTSLGERIAVMPV